MAVEESWANKERLPYRKRALDEILDQLEDCCRRHGEQAGDLPICETCWQRYKRLADKDDKYKIKSEDIRSILAAIE